jgi:hypothetical protein
MKRNKRLQQTINKIIYKEDKTMKKFMFMIMMVLAIFGAVGCGTSKVEETEVETVEMAQESSNGQYLTVTHPVYYENLGEIYDALNEKIMKNLSGVCECARTYHLVGTKDDEYDDITMAWYITNGDMIDLGITDIKITLKNNGENDGLTVCVYYYDGDDLIEELMDSFTVKIGDYKGKVTETVWVEY